MMIPLIDIDEWRTGSARTRAHMASRLDSALCESGFLMLSGHGVSAQLREDIRGAAREFFALPAEVKATYAAPIYGRGWIGPGKEANSFYGEDGDEARPDLKETYTIGHDQPTGDAAIDAQWFAPNVWPSQVPGLQALCTEYTAAMRALNDEMLEMCAAALGLPDDWFTSRCAAAPHTFNINRYPPMSVTGTPAPGQFRVAPHTDWGMLTLLDRQVGYGGLEVQIGDPDPAAPGAPDADALGEWVSAPDVPDAFTVNIGDILARWTGDRWRSTRHRVLPPQDAAPEEELISLIMFFETNVDSLVAPIQGVVGKRAYEPVTAGDYLMERASAASVG